MTRYILGALCALMLLTGQAVADPGQLIRDGGAGTLVMPFDARTNHASFQIVSRVDESSATLATHWSYWAEDCRHLVDVFVCLTPEDTKVMDVTNVQAEVQSESPPSNDGVGSLTNLGPVFDDNGELVKQGESGFVTVAAFEANADAFVCDRASDEPVDGALVGGWVVANTSTNAAFGFSASGFNGATLPDVARLAKISVQTFNPETLGDGFGLAIALQEQNGRGDLKDAEIGPIKTQGGAVCCQITFTDNLEVRTSLPDLCFLHAGFAPILQRHDPNDPSIVPPTTTIDAPGKVTLENCSIFDTPEGEVELEQGQWIIVATGQAIGPFGTVLPAFYTGAMVP